MCMVLLLLAMVPIKFASSEPQFGLQGRTLNAVLAKEGDVNLGQLADITTFDATRQTCGPTPTTFGCEAIQMAMYAIDKINRRTDILPGINVGMVILDTCSKDTKSLEVLTYFGQNPDCPGSSTEYPNGTVSGFSEVLKSYKVVAIVGPRTSKIATAVSSLMGVFQIPLMGTTPTTDALSDKSRYEYFLRVTSPDRYLTAALAKMLHYFGWSYVSVVYNNGPYGENAYQQFSSLLSGGICIGVSKSIPAEVTDKTFADIADALVANERAKVVAVFIDDVIRARTLFRAMRSRRPVGHFVWIGADYMTSYEYEPTMENLLDGSLFVTHPSVPIQDFVSHLQGVTPQTSEGNTWILNVWEQSNGCSFAHSSGGIRHPPKKPCSLNLTLDSTVCPTDPVQHDRLHDAYMVYAQALHNYIAANCPEGFARKELLSDCIRGDDLLRLIQSSVFEGVLGRIKFDENGDMLENVVVKQFYTPDPNSTTTVSRIVGFWNSTDERLYINETALNWTLFQNNSSENASASGPPPVSVCSEPCPDKDYLIRQPDRTCCWTCSQCRDNEIVVEDRSGCQTCPTFTWPDDDNATTCIPIAPDFLRADSFHSVCLMCLTALSCLLVIVCATEYIRRRKTDRRLLEDFGLHLRLMSSAGMLAASVTIVLLLLHPSSFGRLCSLRGVCFHLSVCLIYAPQLVKIVQIYRTFASRAQRPKFVSMRAENIAVASIVSVQVVVVLSTEISSPSQAILKMSNVYTKYVEVYCFRPNSSFAVPLAFNACVLLLTAGAAFMSRKLPVRFDEAWLTFVSVAAVAFCWVVLMPNYFTISQIHLQPAILGYALIINCLITTIVQYLPVLYTLVTEEGGAGEQNDHKATMTARGPHPTTHATSIPAAAAAAAGGTRPNQR